MHVLHAVFAVAFVLKETEAWGYKNGILHNSIWLGPIKMRKAYLWVNGDGPVSRLVEPCKQREMTSYSYSHCDIPHTPQIMACIGEDFKRASSWSLSPRVSQRKIPTDVQRSEGCVWIRRGALATYDQLEAARKIGFHMCAAGWFDKGRVGYPIVKTGSNCGFGKVGIIDYGYRLNKSEKWDVFCYNPQAKECGGVHTDHQKVFSSPGYPDNYQDEQICYWHIRVRYGQRIRLHFLDFDIEEDTSCISDYLEIYDSYDDISGFFGRYCGDELPEDIISTGNVMTLKFLSDSSVTAGGFQLQYIAMNSSLLCDDSC